MGNQQFKFTYLDQNVPADPTQCDLGSTWVHQGIKYECYLNGSIKGYRPTGNFKHILDLLCFKTSS